MTTVTLQLSDEQATALEARAAGVGGGTFAQKTLPLAIIPQKVTRSATVYAVFAIE